MLLSISDEISGCYIASTPTTSCATYSSSESPPEIEMAALFRREAIGARDCVLNGFYEEGDVEGKKARLGLSAVSSAV